MKKAVMNAATGGVFYVSSAEKSGNKLFSIQKSSKVNSYSVPNAEKSSFMRKIHQFLRITNDE